MSSHPLFDFFSKDRPPIDPDSSKWPKSWKTIHWKSYPHYPQIALPKPYPMNTSLEDVITRRASRRDFSTTQKLSLQEISNLLFYSCGLMRPNDNLDKSRRAHPSGGALYPLEIYPLIFLGANEQNHGIHHYNILEHALEKLPEENTEKLKTAFSYPWAADASIILLFSFIEYRTVPKYGNLAYKFALLEAGHISQNIYLTCAAMDLKCCAIGEVDSKSIHQALNIDGISEVVFYAVAVGK